MSNRERESEVNEVNETTVTPPPVPPVTPAASSPPSFPFSRCCCCWHVKHTHTHTQCTLAVLLFFVVVLVVVIVVLFADVARAREVWAKCNQCVFFLGLQLDSTCCGFLAISANGMEWKRRRQTQCHLQAAHTHTHRLRFAAAAHSGHFCSCCCCNRLKWVKHTKGPPAACVCVCNVIVVVRATLTSEKLSTVCARGKWRERKKGPHYATPRRKLKLPDRDGMRVKWVKRMKRKNCVYFRY